MTSALEEPRGRGAALLAELGLGPTLTIYLAGAPGAGKTHRLLTDALAETQAGRRVAIGWIETKGRPDLDELAVRLPRVAPRRFQRQQSTVEDFDFAAAAAGDWETIVLDELAHSNPGGAPHAKRWQDALALRTAGKSVLGAFNVMHLDTAAPAAERIIGHPIRELVPIGFLRRADRVVALDVAPSVLEWRLRNRRVVREEDVERAASGVFTRDNLSMMRELLLRVVDGLTVSVVAASKVSTALAVIADASQTAGFLERAAALAGALDLAFEVTALDSVDRGEFLEATLAVGGGSVPFPASLHHGELRDVRASLVIVPFGEIAERVLRHPVDRTVFVADPLGRPLPRARGDRNPFAVAMHDRLRIGFGKLTIYFGSVAGVGKTYAMLDRAQQLREDGVDVVAALVETHGRADTARLLTGLETISRLPSGEVDFDAVVLRRPQIALIDELAHTNLEPGARGKRYADVFAVLRSGIDVWTTLNVQHLEGLSDAVERLTGTRVRETLPDSVLEFADEVIFIDAAPDVLRQRLRDGKIYPLDRVDAALVSFFTTENLSALRELAIREVLRARSQRGHSRPFARIVLGAAPRERDAELIRRAGRLARRLDIDFRVVVVTPRDDDAQRAVVDKLSAVTAGAGGTLIAAAGADAPERIVEVLSAGDVLAVESPRGRRGLFGGRSFAVRALAAGARDLLVLVPDPVASR